MNFFAGGLERREWEVETGGRDSFCWTWISWMAVKEVQAETAKK